MTDWDLLRQYRDRNSNDAFRRLADRHMRLVYSTCRRDLADPQAAEDATQIVFILLARKARTIVKGASISSWLFSTARFVCKDMIKTEMRRRGREETVETMEASAEDTAEWNVIEPQLNDALSSLTQSDREAVLMRYYAGMSLQEIAGQIGTSEDTARKRVSRAVERLRHYFQRENATAQFLSLDALLLSYAAGKVPPQTQASVMSTLHSLGAAHGASAALNAHAGVLLKKGAIVLMDATIKKILIGLAIAAVIGVGVGIPLVAAHVREQRLIAGDTAMLINAAPAVPNDPQAADKAQLLAVMKRGLDDFARRDMVDYRKGFDPAMVSTIPGQPNMTIDQLIQQDQKVYQLLGSLSITETVDGISIQGETAQLLLGNRISGTTVNYQQVPAGLAFLDDQTDTIVLRDESGQWKVTRVDVNRMQESMAGRIIYQVPRQAL